MKGPLTPKRMNVFVVVCALRKKTGFPPTIAEVAVKCNLSPTTVHEHIRRLVRDGYLRQTKDAIRKYVMKTVLFIILALLLGGCSSKTYHRQAFDPQGNVTESVKITLTDCIMRSEAEQIYVEFDGTKRKLMIGKFSQWPDVETVQVIRLGLQPLWFVLPGL